MPGASTTVGSSCETRWKSTKQRNDRMARTITIDQKVGATNGVALLMHISSSTTDGIVSGRTTIGKSIGLALITIAQVSIDQEEETLVLTLVQTTLVLTLVQTIGLIIPLINSLINPLIIPLINTLINRLIIIIVVAIGIHIRALLVVIGIINVVMLMVLASILMPILEIGDNK